MRILPLLALLFIGCSSFAADAAPPARHIIYLHGRIVQDQQSARPQHPRHGYYELNQIVEALRSRGFVVTTEIRPKAITVDEAADKTVEQVRRLLKSGIPADRITVVGASMGAWITLRVAARLQNPDVRFALVSPCLSTNVKALREEREFPAGRILAIRDESDVPTASCPAWAADPKDRRLTARELVINTGLGHGFIYRPMPEWVEPVVKWASEGR